VFKVFNSPQIQHIFFTKAFRGLPFFGPDHLCSSKAEVIYEWNYTSTPTYAFTSRCIIKHIGAPCLSLIMCCFSVWSVALDLKGPLFIQEPPHRVEFSNSSGGRVDCSAHGSPPPQLAWSLGDGTPVVQVPDLRLVHPNGSLVFPPFPAEHYRHDIHTALYRCKAQNQMGQVVSRDVHVRAGK